MFPTIFWVLLITNWHTPLELGQYKTEATCMAASAQVLKYTQALPNNKPTVYSICIPVSTEGRTK